ncbi:MAG: DUF4249 domain-containing protein [Gemmatimonadales bacterium]
MPRSFAVIILFLATGCTRVVDLDLAEGPRRLVVEGRIELRPDDATGLQAIRLTTTGPFEATDEPPAAIGAVVVVAEEGGRVFHFTREALGGGRRYLAAGFVPRLGAEYTLTVDYDGHQYRASHRLLPVPPIDSLYFEYEDAGLAQGDSGFRAVIDYRDPAGDKNYYLWDLIVDGRQRIGIDPGNRFRIISDDRFYDGGRVIGYQPYDEEVVEPGQRVALRQVALSEAGFRYYAALFEQTTGGGGPFSTPPSSVRGNVINLTDTNRYPLGFFFAAQVAERTAVVPAR